MAEIRKFGITDEEAEAEMAQLKANPDVKLARAVRKIRYKRRQLLYELRNLAKEGAMLRAAGVTLENIKDTFDENGRYIGFEESEDGGDAES